MTIARFELDPNYLFIFYDPNKLKIYYRNKLVKKLKMHKRSYEIIDGKFLVSFSPHSRKITTQELARVNLNDMIQVFGQP